MEFEAPFWPTDKEMIGNIEGAKTGEFAFFFSLLKATGKPILLAHFVASFALQHAETKDADLVDRVVAVLADMFGLRVTETPSKKDDMPSLVKWTVKKWHEDVFSYGSYSHIPCGCDAGARSRLANPVGRTLFFAGEATNTQYPSTIHGAYPLSHSLAP